MDRLRAASKPGVNAAAQRPRAQIICAPAGPETLI